LFITAVIITLAGILLYFLLKPPADILNEQMSNEEPHSEFQISSDVKLKKVSARSILTDVN